MQCYTVKQVAEMLNCSTQKIRQLCKSGKIKALDVSQIGSNEKGVRSYYRIPIKEIDKLLTPIVKEESIPLKIYDKDSMMEWWFNHKG